MKQYPSVLYLFHENPLRYYCGNRLRAYSLLNYFKSRNIIVDFVSEVNNDRGNPWTFEEQEQFKNAHLCRNFFLLNDRFSTKPSKKNIVNYLFKYKIPKLLRQRKQKRHTQETLPNWVSCDIQQQFDQILRTNKYDYIIISYAHFGKLIDNNPYLKKTVTTILDTHDFLTAQSKEQRKFVLGSFLQEEIRRLDLFKQVWTLSLEESYIFQQFSKRRIHLMPPVFFLHHLNGDQKEYSKRYDIIYVASDNPHNVDAVRWFLDKVYPKIPKEVNFCFIGAINKKIDAYDNIEQIMQVDDLTPYYRASKIAICPMLSGTGIKIKVLESLSYGLPVVANIRGNDGLISKVTNGVQVTDDPILFAEKIIRLLGNDAYYKEECTVALNFYNQWYSNEQFKSKLDDIFVVRQSL
ncbi:MAG: glycosyltransferase [Phycisphaerales bacterium]|nr:glycosyltransferase [Phycisphaerales bacterium]